MLEAVAETGDEAAFLDEAQVTQDYSEHVTLAHEQHMREIDAVAATGDEGALAKHCTAHANAVVKTTIAQVRATHKFSKQLLTGADNA